MLLQALEPARINKRLPVLEHVVSRDFLAGNVPRRERPAFFGGHNAHHIVFDFSDSLQRNREQRRVDAIRPWRDDLDLWAALPPLSVINARAF